MQVREEMISTDQVNLPELEEFLSPESYVFVALMSLPGGHAGVEEGQNKASFPAPCVAAERSPADPNAQ